MDQCIVNVNGLHSLCLLVDFPPAPVNTSNCLQPASCKSMCVCVFWGGGEWADADDKFVYVDVSCFSL